MRTAMYQITCKIAGFCKVTQERKGAGIKGNAADGLSTKPSNFDLSSAVTPHLCFASRRNDLTETSETL